MTERLGCNNLGAIVACPPEVLKYLPLQREGRDKEQGIFLKSGLSREDADRGACEIIYVTGVQVERKR